MPPNDMVKTTRSAQKNNTEDIFNRDKSKDGPRPTAKGEERIQKGAKFMPDCTIKEMEERMASRQEGKGKIVLLACIKRKECKTIDAIAKELHRRPGTSVTASYALASRLHLHLQLHFFPSSVPLHLLPRLHLQLSLQPPPAMVLLPASAAASAAASVVTLHPFSHSCLAAIICLQSSCVLV